MFDLPHEIDAGDGVHLTIRSTAAPALILEVRLPPAAAAPWFSALALYGRRFEVLRGSLLLDGDVLNMGQRMLVAPGREITLTAGRAEEAHFVCELRPAANRGAAIAALKTTLTSRPTTLFANDT